MFGKKERKCNQILNEKCIYTQCDEGTSFDFFSSRLYIRHLRSAESVRAEWAIHRNVVCFFPFLSFHWCPFQEHTSKIEYNSSLLVDCENAFELKKTSLPEFDARAHISIKLHATENATENMVQHWNCQGWSSTYRCSTNILHEGNEGIRFVAQFSCKIFSFI